MPLMAAEGQAFLKQWTESLVSGTAATQEACFAPRLLTDDKLSVPTELLAVLRAERSKWADFTLTLAGPLPDPERLPGARWRLRPLLRQEGRRRNNSIPEISPPFTCQPEIPMKQLLMSSLGWTTLGRFWPKAIGSRIQIC